MVQMITGMYEQNSKELYILNPKGQRREMKSSVARQDTVISPKEIFLRTLAYKRQENSRSISQQEKKTNKQKKP